MTASASLEFSGAARAAFVPRQAPASAAAGRRLSEPVRAALEHFMANYNASVTLSDLAALTQRTSYQLIRAFRRELGITPHAMLIRIRIQHAKALLARGEPIAGVAVDVGFVDQTHFGRHFKRVQNETPGRFRRAILGACA